MSACTDAPRLGEVPEETEILWDTWGVPHIYATGAEDLFYAFGWAQMQNHGNLVLRLYGEARGRAAEYWGADYLESDINIHTFGVPERTQVWYETQSPDMKRYLGAFAEGMNAYADAHPDRIADEAKAVLPVTPADPLAHVQRVIHLTFVAGSTPGVAEQWTRSQLGSNAWAVGPSRSASGHAMLLANPHLPWGGFFTWFEAHLVAPGLNAYGAALVGMPILGIAFNDYLGWTHTNNTFDGVDLFELELSGDGYTWDGGVQAFETVTKTLKVREGDGSLRDEPLPIHRSVHGPVVTRQNEKALAARVTGLDQSGMLEQYWDMMRATSLNEFEAALSRLQNPFFNVVYADRDGHIMYLFGGRTPKRASGDWGAWQGVVPGTASGNLWTESLAYEDLPRVVDPPQGWVQNANDPPWTATFPLAFDAAAFPSYLAPQEMGFRPQRSVRMLDEDASITFDELIGYKMSTRMELADRILDDLLPAARDQGSDLARQAADVLEAWDRETNTDSRGAVLFAAWVEAVGPNAYATPWNEAQPRTTPDGLADPSAAVAALEAAAQQVQSAYGALDVPWGDVYRIQVPGLDLPSNGGAGELGIFRVTWYQPADSNRFSAMGGDSYQAVIEFADPVRARVLLSYGNASQPGSPHQGDQLPLYSRKEMRPVWQARAEVEAHLEERTPLRRTETPVEAGE